MVSQPWLWQPWLYTELRAWAAGSPAVVDPALLLVIDSATSDHLHQQMAAAGLSQGAETLAWSVGGAKDSPKKNDHRMRRIANTAGREPLTIWVSGEGGAGGALTTFEMCPYLPLPERRGVAETRLLPVLTRQHVFPSDGQH